MGRRCLAISSDTSGGSGAPAPWCRSHSQSRGGGSDRPRQIEAVPRAAAGPGKNPPWADVANGGDVDDERSRRAGDVPTRQGDASPRRHLGEAVQETVDIGDREPLREDQGQEGQTGGAAHCGHIADIDRQGLVAHVSKGGEAQIEMDSFDHRVGRQDLQFPPDAGVDRRVVADADLQ